MGAGKTATVGAALSGPSGPDVGNYRVVELSAASPDRCLYQHFASRRAARPTQAVPTAELFERLTHERLVVWDALDIAQQADGEHLGEVTDLRLRHVLAAAAAGRWPGLATLVTSRYSPPRHLPASALTVIELAAPPGLEPSPNVVAEPGAPTVLELLASCRQASSGWLLGLATGKAWAKPSLTTPKAVGAALKEAVGAGWVHRVELGESGEWFQIPDVLRAQLLRPERRALARAAFLEALESEQLQAYVKLASARDPELEHDLAERLLSLLLESGDVPGAVLHYWQTLGNFSRLWPEGAIHLGARVCRALNAGHAPEEISPALHESDGGHAVVNDWAQFAFCAGDATSSGAAAQAAYAMLPNGSPPWDQALLAGHIADALLLRGDMSDALRWAQKSWDHATEAMQKTQGLATSEIMEAYEHAAGILGRVRARMEGTPGVARTLEDLVDVNERARNALAEFNRHAVLPLPGPTGVVEREQLLNGRLSATLALLEGRLADVRRIVMLNMGSWSASQRQSPAGIQLRLLLLRARVAEGSGQGASDLLTELRAMADTREDVATACALATISARMQLREGDAQAALALVDDYLLHAANCHLGLHWIDLLTVRSTALLTLGRNEEARSSAETALLGPGGDPSLIERVPFSRLLPGAYQVGDRSGMETAVSALRDAGGEVDQRVLAALARPRDSQRPPRRATPPRTAPESRAKGTERRVQQHNAALAVIDNYRTRGLPFALYLRKYDFDILHGPMELGPRLTENALRDALHPDAEVLAIQAHNKYDYSGAGTRAERDAPALLLPDDKWEEVAAALIAMADLIVSEPTMLGQGVGRELQLIQQANRWDRTVLLLPPLESPFETIDNEEVVQMFPRCIWADALHTESVADSPVVRDLLARMDAIASLGEEERRALIEPAARDAAYPIDLLPVAEHYEKEATLPWFGQERDERDRYYGFWQLFRAAAIRGVKLLQGDASIGNRSRLADDYLHLSAAMLPHAKDGDRFVLEGDLAFALQCAQSAWNLLRDDAPSLLVQSIRTRAEKQLGLVLRVREAVETEPARIAMRPRYGPFKTRTWPKP